MPLRFAMLRRGVLHTARLVVLSPCPLSVRCTMCGCTGGVSVYLPILPYYYNIFLRVHFSKSVRVRGWGCLCRVVGFAFNGRPACVGEACRRVFRVLFSPRRSWLPVRGPTCGWVVCTLCLPYVVCYWVSGVHVVSRCVHLSFWFCLVDWWCVLCV